MYWSLNSPDDGTQKLGLWEIIGFERDLGNPHDGISISGKLQKIFHCVRIQQDSGYLQKRKGTLTNKLITLQERILEWVVMLFSMASSWLRNWTCVSCIAGRFFTYQATWETHHMYQFSSVQSLSRVLLFATPWITACQASLPITNSHSSLRLTSIKSVMPSSHLILCRPLLLLPPILLVIINPFPIYFVDNL